MRLIVFASVLVTVFMGFSCVPAAAIDAHAQIVPAKLHIGDPSADLVVQTEGVNAFDQVQSLAQAHGVKVKFSNAESGLISLGASGADQTLVKGICAISGVSDVSSEVKAHTLFTPDDPYVGVQWALGSIDAFQAWDITRGSHNVIVGELDTGVDWNHPDLAANIWNDTQGYHGYNFISNNPIPMDDNINSFDNNGLWQPNTYIYHGTHVAGVLGAVMNNGRGVAGMAQVRIMAVKVMNDSGEGTDTTVAAGLRWAVDHGANIVTMSLGVDGMSTILQTAVNYASGKGVVMVAASGNSGSSFVSYPAAYPPVIAVGALDTSVRRASFSNYGPGIDLMAPGVQIYSTQGSDSYQYLSGTSTATPYVAGVVGLMLTVNPALTPTEVGDVLNHTATDVSMTGYDTSTGWGNVNAFRAVEQISQPTVTITSHPSFVAPNAKYSISWIVTGGSPGVIQSTYIAWGTSPTTLDHNSASFNGTTWATFTVDNLPSLPANGTLYVRGIATVDGIQYQSELLTLPVHKPESNSLFSQFVRNVQNFIVNDLGVFNFLLILIVIIAIPSIVIAARHRSRKVVIQSQFAYPPPRTLQEPMLHPYLPPPPPPPPRYEAYIDLVGHQVNPETIRVIEGTKIVWVNRSWAPPPGIAVKSGKLDDAGEHPDGMFHSGMLIAPGDYWSATFHRAGVYDYYLTGIWKAAKIVVEPFRPNEPPMTHAS